MRTKTNNDQINLILIKKLLPVSVLDLLKKEMLNFNKIKHIIYSAVIETGVFIHSPFIYNPRLIDKECYEDLITVFYNNKSIWNTLGKVQFKSQFLDTKLEIQITKDFIILKFVFGENDEWERNNLLQH